MNKIANIKQVAKELHKPARKNYETRKVIVYNVDDIWSCDLVDMIKYSDKIKDINIF